MTTIDTARLPSIGSLLSLKLAAMLSKRAQARTNTRVNTRGWIQALSRFLLTVSGFTCLTWAGFTISFTIGLVSAAFSCFSLSWLATGSTSDEANDGVGQVRMR